MVRVPFTLITILSMSAMYFLYGADIDYMIWSPFLGFMLFGSFFVGNVKNKFPWLEYIGQTMFILGPLYITIMALQTYGLPHILDSIIAGFLFIMYCLTVAQSLNLSLREVWKEYIYTLILFVFGWSVVIAGIGQFIIPAVFIYIISELGLQIVRLSEKEIDVEYELASIYLISMAILVIPKTVF